jgi:ribosomal-protein-alanine N-acetyltransferase
VSFVVWCGLDGQYNNRVPFIIREFQATDFDTLWRIDQGCFPPGISYSRQELKTYMRRRGSFTLVAVDGKEGEPSGFIVAEADGRGTGHVITIDVSAPARRTGVGSLLLRAAEERLRAARCSTVELETAVDNAPALSFYKRHGYSVTRTFPRYYSNGVDALVLEKDLLREVQKNLRK